MLLPSKCPSWEEDYNPISDSLNDSSCISQVRVTGSLKVGAPGRAPAPTPEDRHQARPLLSGLCCASVQSLFSNLPARVSRTVLCPGSNHGPDTAWPRLCIPRAHITGLDPGALRVGARDLGLVPALSLMIGMQDNSPAP